MTLYEFANKVLKDKRKKGSEHYSITKEQFVEIAILKCQSEKDVAEVVFDMIKKGTLIKL